MKLPAPIDYADALDVLRAAAQAHAHDRCDVLALEQARGRILAEAILAPGALPRFANAAMDGFALRAQDLPRAATTGLAIAGERFAGATTALHCGSGQCVRITTGAALPDGADTVVPRELVRELTHDPTHDPAHDPAHGPAHEPALGPINRILLQAPIAAGANVRGVGEDVAEGMQVAAAGEELAPARIGLLAALGVASVRVRARPRVALLVSGDELRGPPSASGAPLAAGEIHDSNGPMLLSLLAAHGVTSVRGSALADDPAQIAVAIAQAARTHDLVVTCGGASVGARDFLPTLLGAGVVPHGAHAPQASAPMPGQTGADVLAAGARGDAHPLPAGALGLPVASAQALAGVRLHFWRVRIKPGMPVLCASLHDALVLALPGNPVSAFCCFHAFVLPALAALQGRAPPALLHARLQHDVAPSGNRHELRRGLLRCAADGSLLVALHASQGSHQLRAVAECNALVHIDAGSGALGAGTPVAVQPYGAILPQ